MRLTALAISAHLPLLVLVTVVTANREQTRSCSGISLEKLQYVGGQEGSL